MPQIHYLWVGAPTKTNVAAVAGHDIAAPIQMAKQLQQEGKEKTNPIKFWCLKEYEKSYREQFSEKGVSVEVCSIEDFIENEIRNGEFADYANFVKKYMTERPLSSAKDKVQFKDLFSLFLLVCQPGYCFDTNVFPTKDQSITLNDHDTVTTAKSGAQRSNDFYMMYSPDRGNKVMKAVFEAWIREPKISNLDVFRVSKIPYFDFDAMEDMGVKKVSYKSYQGENVRGLFYWLERANRLDRIDELEENLAYGDINHQTAYPLSIKILNPCSLCYLNGDNPEPNLLNLKFNTDEAYVATDSNKIYYVNKKDNSFALVFDGDVITLFNEFPHKLAPPEKQITKGEPEDLQKVLSIILNDSKHATSQASQFHPSYIINTQNCTLLHQAVLNNNIAQIQCLLKAGARTDLVATYEVKPEGKIINVTPLELATYLKHPEVMTLLQQETKEKSDVVEAKISPSENKKQSPKELPKAPFFHHPDIENKKQPQQPSSPEQKLDEPQRKEDTKTLK